MKNVLKLVIGVALCQGIGLAASTVTIPAISSWYEHLQKPSFSPPNWLFSPVWITLYFLMGVSLFLIWRQGLRKKGVGAALIVFGAQLVFNALWSVAFFGLRSPLAGVVVILILWVLILITIFRFIRLSQVAGVMLLPYLLWVSFATVLNVSIWLLNS